jgi:hypothetical protein
MTLLSFSPMIRFTLSLYSDPVTYRAAGGFQQENEEDPSKHHHHLQGQTEAV